MGRWGSGEAAMGQIEALFASWHRFRGAEVDRAVYWR